MQQPTYKLGDTKPDLTGLVPGVDLTSGATITCDLRSLTDGTAPFVSQTAVFVSYGPLGSKVKYVLPAAFPAAGDYVGWFVGVLSGKTYRSSGFTVRVLDPSRTPTTHPVAYGDGRGGYAEAADVIALIANKAAMGKTVDETLVEMALGDTAIEIDSSLEQLYTMPVTTAQPVSWARLRLIHKFWALAWLYDILVPTNEAFGGAAVLMREKGTAMLDDLIEGTVQLPDAVALAGKPVPAPLEGAGATYYDGMDTDASGNLVEPIFSVDTFRHNGRIWK